MLGIGIGSGTLPGTVTSTGVGTPFTTYNGVALAGQGLPLVLSVVRTTGIAANQSATNFVAAAPAAGNYIVVATLVVTTTFTTSGPLLTLGYTDSVGAQSSVAIPATAVGAGSVGSAAFALNTTGVAQVTYAVTSAGTFGAVELTATLLRIS